MRKLKGFGISICLLIVIAIALYIYTFESFYDNGAYYCSKLQNETSATQFGNIYGGADGLPIYSSQLSVKKTENYTYYDSIVRSNIDQQSLNYGNVIEFLVDVDPFLNNTGLIISLSQPLFAYRESKDYKFKDKDYKIIIDIQRQMIQTVFNNVVSDTHDILFTSIYLDGDYVNVYFVDIRHVVDYLDTDDKYKEIDGYKGDYVEYYKNFASHHKGPLSIMDGKKQYISLQIKSKKNPILIRNTLQFIRIPSNLFNCDEIYDMETYYPKFLF